MGGHQEIYMGTHTMYLVPHSLWCLPILPEKKTELILAQAKKYAAVSFCYQQRVVTEDLSCEVKGRKVSKHLRFKENGIGGGFAVYKNVTS